MSTCDKPNLPYPARDRASAAAAIVIII